MSNGQMEEEEGSLHLSDLSGDYNQHSSGFVLGSNTFSLREKSSASDRLVEYASHLYDAKSNLDHTQSLFEIDMKQSRAKLQEEEEEVKSHITNIKDKEMKLRALKAQNEREVAQERKTIFDLENEEARVEKSSAWAQAILENTHEFELRQKLRSEIIQKMSDVANLSEQIRNIRNVVFGQQKVLVDISESISSLRMRSYTLSSRIEAVMEDGAEELEESSATLNKTMGQTRMVAINQQKLAIEKMQIQKKIAAMKKELDSLRAEKARLIEKLTPLRIHDDTAIEKIIIQRDQYVTALAKHREMVKSVTEARNDCVAKEIDAKVEHDAIADAKSKVMEEIAKVRETLKDQERRITEMKQFLSNDKPECESVQEDVTYESILRDTISQIREKREEYAILTRSESDFTPEIDESEFDEMKSLSEMRIKRVQRAVALAKRENDSIREEVTELETGLSVREDVPVIQSPKATRESLRIRELEAEVAKAKAKCEKKRAKVARHREEIAQLKTKAASPQLRTFVIRDLVSRVEVSANWLMANLRKAKATWTAATTVTQMKQLVKDWENRVMAAAVNEAEDLEIRGSIAATTFCL